MTVKERIIDLVGKIPPERLEEARRILWDLVPPQDRERVAVSLFQKGLLSTREGADWLGLTYEEFRDLAARHGAATLHFDEEAAQREMRRLGVDPA